MASIPQVRLLEGHHLIKDQIVMEWLILRIHFSLDCPPHNLQGVMKEIVMVENFNSVVNECFKDFCVQVLRLVNKTKVLQ